ncbi:phosphotransferase family protein [Stachybotrys elegans]|uniref:Phosphotransferase family protein n=1 Tax=Stachybotrys elegans TaxID=80388 RepID=A0A8K0SLB8_9HYPO|nr:phosphotransferase family protein [Stachybotrys elegans]
MYAKLRLKCMQKDDLVWEKLENDMDEWDASVRTSDVYASVVAFILKHKPGKGKKMHSAVRGGYNTVYQLEYEDGTSVIMRVPVKDVVGSSEEKVLYEVATMRYVAEHTSIPVPRVYCHGTAKDNPTGLGPFIIMDYIEHHQNMSRALLDPKRDIDERPVLDPNITEEKLEYLYSQMADILLQLSHLQFPRIGSLIEDPRDGSVFVGGRPLTANMNDISIHTNAPPSVLPTRTKTYSTAEEWYRALSDMHMIQLAFQHNDAVEDEDDARDKYVARLLYRQLAIRGQLFDETKEFDGQFRLFSEDLRPTNVLLDKDLKVVGVIDWEFAHVAPAQFAFDPPWWLLLLEPEDWEDGYDGWMKAYEPRLETFLRVLRAEEDKMAAEQGLDASLKGLTLQQGKPTEKLLSERMRESWATRRWMVNYAARKSWSFDFVWWRFLDQRYFGPNEVEDHQERLSQLSEEQKSAMVECVSRKVREKSEAKIVHWEDKGAAGLLESMLV